GICWGIKKGGRNPPHIADKVRFIDAGCGANALSGLQKFVNSINCRIHVGLISEAHQAFLLLSSVSG
ncbi:hypothetical protein FIC40_16805, partial [Escherichia coli]